MRFLLVPALIISFFIGRYSASTPKPNADNCFDSTSFINELNKALNTDQGSAQEITEKLFLLLLTQLGQSDLKQSFKNKLVKDKSTVNLKCQPKIVTKEVIKEVIKYKKNQDEVIKKGQVKFQGRLPRSNSPRFFKKPKSTSNEKQGLLLGKGLLKNQSLHLPRGRHEYQIIPVTSAIAPSSNILLVDFNLIQGSQNKWSGSLKATLENSLGKVISEHNLSNIENSISLLATSPESISIDIQTYIIHLYLTQENKHNANTLVGTLYKKIDEDKQNLQVIGSLKEITSR